MEIGAVKIAESNVNHQTIKNSDNSTSKGKFDLQADTSSTQVAEDGKGKKELNKEELLKVNNELNKFMSVIDPRLQFSLHEKTNQLMVQVVDTKNDKVLKEFPSHEMLDMIANIREYVGALLDQKV